MVFFWAGGVTRLRQTPEGKSGQRSSERSGFERAAANAAIGGSPTGRAKGETCAPSFHLVKPWESELTWWRRGGARGTPATASV